MKTTTQTPSSKAMAFYHKDGLPASWQQAAKYAGDGGRLATMPDIIAARLGTKLGDAVWETYSTTRSAEYFGYTKQGNPILIVAHGVGPMSTLDGARKAYSWVYKSKDRGRTGGRITQQEFWDLEAGKFGEVGIVDFAAYCQRYEYPLLGTLRASEAMTDPLLKARFGPETEAYVLAHAAHAREWHLKQAGVKPENTYKLGNWERHLSRREEQHLKDGQAGSDPFIIKVEGASNCSYGSPKWKFRKLEEGYALAHLISTGALMHLCHEGGESLVNDVGCHEWSNGVRFVGIPAACDIGSGVRPGPDTYTLIKKHWKELLVWTDSIEEVGFRALTKIGKQWFTQYLKNGERMDNEEPEYVVQAIEEVEHPILFRTTVGGYHGWFKYGINEVETIAPTGANAYYLVGDPQIETKDGEPMHHTCMVQFYRITVDVTKRVMREEQLCHDFSTMMKLVDKKAA